MSGEQQITTSDQSQVAVQDRPAEAGARSEYLDTLRDIGTSAVGTTSDTASQFLLALDITDNQAESDKQPDQIEQKEKELEDKYGIKFGQPGDAIGQKIDVKGNPTGEWAYARKPTMEELQALEAALQHSEPSFRPNADGTPVRVNFSDDSVLPGGKGKATFDPPGRNHPNEAQLNIWGGTKNLPKMDADVVGERDHENTSLEEIITHELGHATQWQTNGLGTDAQYKRDLGWVPLKEPADQSTRWAITGKDGNLYQLRMFQRADGHIDAGWEQLPPNAGYDAEGKYQGQPTGVMLSMEEMREQAAVTPNSDYFVSPEEYGAETLKDYRLNSARRSQLLQEYPGAYEAARKLDQRELDRYYGEGTKVRMPDGTVADNTAANRAAIASWEGCYYSTRAA